MQAFTSVRDEMRRAIAAITQQATGEGVRPMLITRGQPGESEAEEGEAWQAEPWMEAAFDGLIHTAETGDPFTLIPCTMNGEPAVVIGLIRQQGRQTHVMPLFLACQPWMKFGPPKDG